jgi:signal transduction histidine kinase
MKNRYPFVCVIVAFLIGMPLRGFMQSMKAYTDSIYQYLLTDKPDTGKSYLLLRLSQLPDCLPDSLLAYGEQWYAYTKQRQITAGQPEALYAMGFAWYKKAANENAVSSLYKAAKFWEANGNNPVQLARTYELIAAIYKTIGRYTDALTYYRQSYQLKKTQNKEAILMSTYNGLGNTFRQLGNTDSAIFYLKKTLTLAVGNELAMAQVSNNLGNIFFSLENFTVAIDWYNQALQHFKIVNHPAGIAEVYFNLGSVASQQQHYQQAITYYNQSLQATPAGQPLEHLEWIYQHLAEAYYKTGNLQQAYANEVRYAVIKDSSLSLNMQKSIADLKEKYETAKKENALALEQARTSRLSIINNNQVRLIYILVIVTVLIVGMGYLLFRNMKRKQLLTAELATLKEKEKQQLIQEQALKNNLAMLEGREMERQRISRDLHDRVGSTLSSVNLFVKRIKNNSPEIVDTTGKIESLLNEAIDDVRRISHDLSDRILQQYGLQAALEDLKDTATGTGTMKVALYQQAIGPLPAHLQAEIYYICRELVTNAIKHSKATQLSIQLMKEGSQLYLTVEDNGKGFDTTQVHTGIGLTNIKTRANKIQASYTVDSQLGHGACVSFIIPLQ